MGTVTSSSAGEAYAPLCNQHQIAASLPETPKGGTGEGSGEMRAQNHFLASRPQLGMVEDIDDAISRLRRALSRVSDSHPDRPELLSSLSSTYHDRFQCLGEISDINTAIDFQARALSLTLEGHTNRPMLLSKLGNCYNSRFEHRGELSDGNRAVDFQIQASSLVPEGHPDKAGILGNLGRAYWSRFQHLGDVSDIDEAILHQSYVLSLIPSHHVDRGAISNDLGNSYNSRFTLLGDISDLNKAIDNRVQAVSPSFEGHPYMPGWLGNLGRSYLDRFVRLGELSDVDEAIKCQNQALSLLAEHHPDKLALLADLGRSYQSRFWRSSDLSDINRAIGYQAQVLSLTLADHPDRPYRLADLGNSHEKRFYQFGEPSDINKAIELQVEALSLISGGHAEPEILSRLGNSYNGRFSHLGDILDVNSAIDCQTRAVSLIPEGHSNRSKWLVELGNSYQRRFDRLSELSDVDNAIDFRMQALSRVSGDLTDRRKILGHLGNSYTSRFRQLGEPSDVDRAIDCQAEAVSLAEGDADKPQILSDLGNSYNCRFELSSDISDVHKAIDCHSQAVSLTPDGHSDRPRRLSNLGNSCQRRFERLGQLSDLNRAIDSRLQALSLIPDGHSSKPAMLSNLGSSFVQRFENRCDISDINNAIEYTVRAVSLTPDGNVDKPRFLSNLGGAYQRRFENLRRPQDINSAITCFQEAATSKGPAYVRFHASRHWARLSFHHGTSSPQIAYERTMELIPQLVWLGTTIKRRYEIITEMGDIVTEAASCAIGLGAYDSALEWLEEGRSIVWNQILQLRTPFDDLFDANPSLAQRLRKVGCALENAGSRSTSADPTPGDELDLEKEAQRHRAQAIEWDQLLQEVRHIPGFQDFMSRRKAGELKSTAKNGPVVLINVHNARCDALIIRPGVDEVAHLPLENFSMEKAVAVRDQLRLLMGHRGLIFKARPRPPNHEGSWKLTLETLWLDVVKPLLDFLGYIHKLPIDQMPHITWCTTGALSFLPLHAAGCYNGSDANAFNLVISSYTPTLSALLVSVPRISAPNSGVLAVGQANTPGQSPLPYTEPELAAIKAHVKTTRYLQLDGDKATIDKVLKAMEEYNWVHIACHATQDTADPAQSAFHLHDGSLMLSEITKRSFKNKGLAFLSACQTAAGDKKMPDEAVHLAAGMLMAGYPSVIATMWSIWDEDGPEVAGEVYAELLKDRNMDCTRAARALHKAVGRLREKVGVDAVQRWAPFVHIGV